MSAKGIFRQLATLAQEERLRPWTLPSARENTRLASRGIVLAFIVFSALPLSAGHNPRTAYIKMQRRRRVLLHHQLTQ